MQPQADSQRAALERLLTLAGETEARRIVAATGRAAALAELERVIDLGVAVRLLQDRAPRSVVRDRLVSRGISKATAYRLIEEALDHRGPGCLTGGPALRQEPATIVARPLPQPDTIMPINTKDLQTKLDTARAELASLDIDGARVQAAAAQKELDEIDAQIGQSLPPIGVSAFHPGAGALTARRGVMVQGTKAARGAVLTKELRAKVLVAQIRRLETMLDSVALEHARLGVKAAAELVADAQVKVFDAEKAATTIDAMIVQAEKDFDCARGTAAAQLLQAVKAGADGSAVPAATRDKIATLELARDSAAQELAAARAALQTLNQRQREAQHQVRVAEAAAAELAHELQRPDYVQTLGEHIAAHIRAHRQQPPVPNLLAQAHEVAKTLLEADEA